MCENDQSPERKRRVQAPRACAWGSAWDRVFTQGYTAAVLCLSLLCTGGCGHNGAEQTPANAGVIRSADKGPVSVTLSAAPATLEFQQHVQLRLEIIAEKGVTVSEPEYGRALADGDRQFQYRVVRSEKKLGEPTGGGKLRWTYRFELEFFLPGEHELPPAEVSFVDMRAVAEEQAEDSAVPASAEVQTLVTEPVTIVVHPPGGVELSAEELRNITRLDPVELPAVWSRWWWLVPVVAVAVVVAAVLLVRRLRRRSQVLAAIPAHEWARRQLVALVTEDLIGKGRTQEFYYRVSDIVRGYIERRFGVSAPEMTTEEFLAAVGRVKRTRLSQSNVGSDDPTYVFFGERMTDELNRFLSACDLVKFARHEPRREESDAVLTAAGDFVERTRERIAPIRSGRADGVDHPPRPPCQGGSGGLERAA